MIRPPLRASVFLILLGLPAAGPPRADPGAGPRIDLSVPDPAGLEELPGIEETEIAVLQEIAGPGAGDLGDRLAGTGIVRERLQLWAPYLEIRGAGRAPLRGSIRIVCERKPARPLRSFMRCSLPRGPVRCEVLLEQTLPARQATAKAVREARLGYVFRPSATVWAGSCTGGIQGGNPWDDPLRRSSPGSALSGRFRMRSSRTARGIVAMIGSHGLAAWQREGEGPGLLLALAGGPGTLFWYGRESGRGDGVGGSFPSGMLRCAASIHRLRSTQTAVCLGLQAVDRPTHAAFAWALGAREGHPRTRLDAGTCGHIGRWRVRFALSLISDEQEAHSRSSGRLRLGWGEGARRAVWSVAWDERLLRFRAEHELAVRAGYLVRLDGRSSVSADGAPVLLSLISSREGCRAHIELGLLGRSGSDLSWPGIGVRESIGRAAVRLAIDHASGGIRVRTLLLAPVGPSGRVSPEDLFWQVSLEQRGG